MAQYYNPKNMALIAGAELDPEERIPRVFSYYAEDDLPENIIIDAGSFPFIGNGFFGLSLPGYGTPMTPEEAQLPTMAGQFCPGCGIMVYGPHQDVIGTPDYDKYWIMYLRVTSLWKEITEYTTVFFHEQP